jgi:hypothetical protein
MDRIDRHNKSKLKNGKYMYSGKHIRQKESLLQQQCKNKDIGDVKKQTKKIENK